MRQRWRWLLAALAVFALETGGLSPPPAHAQAERPPAGAERRQEVDVELVLAVDISYSMDPEELRIQRQGYIDALTAPKLIETIRGGMTGQIGVTYFEWAGVADQHLIVDWTIVSDLASARAVADRLANAPIRRARRTSVSGAIDFGMGLLAESPFRGIRQVIDVSGDGPNNQGRPVERARDDAVEKGIIINGLPIILDRNYTTPFDIANLDDYYRDCVVGGPGSFLLVIRSRDQFGEAIKSKLLREIAQLGQADVPPGRRAPRADCFAGERAWSERWER